MLSPEVWLPAVFVPTLLEWRGVELVPNCFQDRSKTLEDLHVFYPLLCSSPSLPISIATRLWRFSPARHLLRDIASLILPPILFNALENLFATFARISSRTFTDPKPPPKNHNCDQVSAHTLMMPHTRQESLTDCPPGYQYYNCTMHAFQGCCSIDPCGLQVACPMHNQPGFSFSPDTMASSIVSSAPPASASRPLSASETIDAAAPETATLAPTAITAPDTTSSTQSPPHSTSSSTTAPAHPSSPKVNHAGLIAGLVVGISAVLIIMVVMVRKLWRRRQRKGVTADQRSLLMEKLRANKYRLPQGASGSAPIITPDKNKPVPPVPTYAEPWQRSPPEARHERYGAGALSPTGPNTPRDPTSRQTSIRAVPFSPSRAGPPRTPRSNPSRNSGGATGGAPSRAVSPVDSFFDSSLAQRDSLLEDSWMSSEPEYPEPRSPAEFHGLSAPPRSRDGSRPDMRGSKPTA